MRVRRHDVAEEHAPDARAVAYGAGDPFRHPHDRERRLLADRSFRAFARRGVTA
jgi:hypothetical protein